MTITEQLKQAMEQEEIKELEENGIDDNERYGKMDNFDNDNCVSAAGNNQS